MSEFFITIVIPSVDVDTTRGNPFTLIRKNPKIVIIHYSLN